MSQTFQSEKSLSETDLGCTQAVADAIRPKLNELGLELRPNKALEIPRIGSNIMTYDIKKLPAPANRGHDRSSRRNN